MSFSGKPACVITDWLGAIVPGAASASPNFVGGRVTAAANNTTVLLVTQTDGSAPLVQPQQYTLIDVTGKWQVQLPSKDDCIPSTVQWTITIPAGPNGQTVSYAGTVTSAMVTASQASITALGPGLSLRDLINTYGWTLVSAPSLGVVTTVQGIAGTPSWKGVYSAITLYAAGDAVSYGGSSFVAAAPLPAGTTPPGTATSNSNWTVLAGNALTTANPMTGSGDMIFGSVTGAATRLPAGLSSQVLIGGATPSFGMVPVPALPLATPTVSGAVYRPRYNVHRYGAVGDGVTNDTAAFLSAQAAAWATGGIVEFAALPYLLDNIALPTSDADSTERSITYEGQVSQWTYGSTAASRKYGTRLIFSKANGSDFLSAVSAGTGITGRNTYTFRNLTLVGPDALGVVGLAGNGLRISGTSVPFVLIDNVQVNNFGGAGASGVWLDNCEDGTIANLSCIGCYYGLKLTGAANANSFINVQAQLCYQAGILINGADSGAFIGGLLQSNYGAGMMIQGAVGWQFSSTHFENNNTAGTAGVYGLMIAGTGTQANEHLHFNTCRFSGASQRDQISITGTSTAKSVYVTINGGYCGLNTGPFVLVGTGTADQNVHDISVLNYCAKSNITDNTNDGVRVRYLAQDVLPGGTSAAPALAFGTGTTGLYYDAPNAGLAFTVAGVRGGSLRPSGWFLDNGYPLSLGTDGGSTQSVTVFSTIAGMKTQLTGNNLNFYRAGASNITQNGAGGSLSVQTQNSAASALLTRVTIGSGDTAPITFTGTTSVVGSFTATSIDGTKLSWATATALGGLYLIEINPRKYGAVGDGASHPLSGVYATLAAAQVVYPFATDLRQELDWAGIQKAINVALGSEAAPAVCPGDPAYTAALPLAARTATGKVVIPPASYKINAQISIIAASGLHIRATGARFIPANVPGTTSIPAIFKWDGMSDCSFDDMLIVAGDGTEAITEGFSYQWSGAATTSRASTRNVFRRCSISGARYITGWAVGTSSGSLQVDQSSLYDCAVYGNGVTPQTDATYYQNGFQLGSGTSGNCMLIGLYSCQSFWNIVGFYDNECKSLLARNIAYQGNAADWKVVSESSVSIVGGRSEGSAMFLTTSGPTATAAMIDVIELDWSAAHTTDDGTGHYKWAEMDWAGVLRLQNVKIQANSPLFITPYLNANPDTVSNAGQAGLQLILSGVQSGNPTLANFVRGNTHVTLTDQGYSPLTNSGTGFSSGSFGAAAMTLTGKIVFAGMGTTGLTVDGATLYRSGASALKTDGVFTVAPTFSNSASISLPFLVSFDPTGQTGVAGWTGITINALAAGGGNAGKLFFDAQNAGSSAFQITSTGAVNIGPNAGLSATEVISWNGGRATIGYDGAGTYGTVQRLVVQAGPSKALALQTNGSVDRLTIGATFGETALMPAYGTQTAGSLVGVSLLPSITHGAASTASFTALQVNATVSGTTTGTNSLLDLRLGGVPKFTVDSTGALTTGIIPPTLLTGTGTVPLAALAGITTTQLSATAGIVAGQIASVNASALSGTVPLASLAGITTTQLSNTAGIVAGQIASVNPSVLTGTGTVPLGGIPALPASQITSGTFGDSFIASGITASKISGALSGATIAASALTGTPFTKTQQVTATAYTDGNPVFAGSANQLTLASQLTGGTDETPAVWEGQQFTPSATISGSLGGLVSLWVKSSAANVNAVLVVALYSDTAGVPGTKIAGNSTQLSAAALSTTAYTQVYLPTGGITGGLTSGTPYWIVVKALSGGFFYDSTLTTGTNVVATAPDSAGVPGTWTLAAGTKSLRYSIYSPATASLSANNTFAGALSLSSTGYAGLSSISTYSAGLTAVSTHWQGGLFTSTTYFGIQANSVWDRAGYLYSQQGIGLNVVQRDTLVAANANAVLRVERQGDGTTGGYSGALIFGNDQPSAGTSTGPLVDLRVANTIKFKVDQTGLLTTRHIGSVVSSTTSTTGLTTGTAYVAGSYSVVNNDLYGTISITNGGAGTAGAFLTVPFQLVFGVAPVVTLTPTNGAASALQVYVTQTTTGFTVISNQATAATTYTWNFHVHGS